VNLAFGFLSSDARTASADSVTRSRLAGFPNMYCFVPAPRFSFANVNSEPGLNVHRSLSLSPSSCLVQDANANSASIATAGRNKIRVTVWNST
jgi:hypothetical protein